MSAPCARAKTLDVFALPIQKMNSNGKRIVLATYGSFGDLHPYIAIAIELRERGHHPVIATSGFYRSKIEAEGLEMRSLRPDAPPQEREAELMRRALDRKRGMEYLFKEFMLTDFRASYEDLRDAVRGADLLVTHPLAFAGPIIVEQTGIKWLSTVLAPLTLFSAYDPGVPPMSPAAHSLLKLHPAISRIAIKIGERATRSLVRAVDDLRSELKLPAGAHPLFAAQHAPRGVLALFSELFARRQSDHPPQTELTGFPFYDASDRTVRATLTPELRQFLDEGEPPIVFTLGSAAHVIADDFYRESLAAAVRLGRRAVLLIGGESNLPADLPATVRAVAYAPFSELFPRASCVVCSGGIGTIAQVMRAGVPALVMPFSFDQPDNADRLRRLHVSRTIEREDYRAARVANELTELHANVTYRRRAAEVGRAIRSENGQRRACDLIERELAAAPASPRRAAA